MYDMVKYVAETENGYRIERLYEFDESKKKIGESAPGTTVVYDADGNDIGRGASFEAVMSIKMEDYVEEVALLMNSDEDTDDIPSSAEEAEDNGFFEIRSVDTVEISDGEIRVFASHAI